MSLSPDTLIAVIVGPIWLIGLTVCYYAFGLNKNNSSKEESKIKEGC
ncbi:hypothetical protein CLCAR_2551 [Clostridium carboxidivorans P7]|nr:hypothetical protein [Clostridium carboxidivorans]EFG87708.1 hypothetical protein CLCAR_2551 [Clostridium carboxidivorans P7]